MIDNLIANTGCNDRVYIGLKDNILKYEFVNTCMLAW
mgnify:CR=1 FL=1